MGLINWTRKETNEVLALPPEKKMASADYNLIQDSVNSIAGKDVAQVAHGFPVGAMLGMDGENWILADSTLMIPAVAVCTVVTDTDNFTVQKNGWVPSSIALPSGGRYYLGEAGEVQTEAPANAQHCFTVIEVGAAMLEFGDMFVPNYIPTVEGGIFDETFNETFN